MSPCWMSSDILLYECVNIFIAFFLILMCMVWQARKDLSCRSEHCGLCDSYGHTPISLQKLVPYKLMLGETDSEDKENLSDR